ncbi:uncharacterized protein [Amphiura filiformis]|uniref:uncharacterized protein isoform X3 n=1 Tax=Amphiura filiformis TaxID=82378 RepID=UPI003B22646B
MADDSEPPSEDQPRPTSFHSVASHCSSCSFASSPSSFYSICFLYPDSDSSSSSFSFCSTTSLSASSDTDSLCSTMSTVSSSNGDTSFNTPPETTDDNVAESGLYAKIRLQEKQKKEAYDLAKLEMLTGGFLDTAALESNAALLALLLKQATNDGFFWTVVALVVVAVCLQVAIGVILAFRFRSTLDMEEGSTGQASKKGGCFERLDASCWCSPKVLLFFAAVLLMVLNVVNMFIIAFAGQVSDQEEQAVEAAAPEVQ